MIPDQQLPGRPNRRDPQIDGIAPDTGVKVQTIAIAEGVS